MNRLRKLIGGELLALSEGRVSLDRRRCWIDTWAFEHPTGQANAAEKAGDNEVFLRLTQNALGLYRGHFLASEPDEPWAFARREQFRTRFLNHNGRLARHWENSGEWRSAMACYQKGLEIDALAKECYQGLMRCYQNLGCRAEAAETYHRCKRELSLSLGIKPSAATERLYRALIAG